MKNKKITIIVGLIISLIIIFLITHPSVLRTPPLSRGGINTEIEPKALSEKNVKVSLIVQEKRYETGVKKGETVYDAMKSIESVKENNFSFKTKEYPSLGIFVEGINEVMGESGKYWIYYVNDKEASVSVSKYVLKSGDIINWKRE